MKYPDNISPNSVASLLKIADWISLHKAQLELVVNKMRKLSLDWAQNSAVILDSHFLPILSDEETSVLRARLSSWWRLSWQKNLWAWQSRYVMLSEFDSEMRDWNSDSTATKQWIGPQDETTVSQMTATDRQNWRDATIAAAAIHSKLGGLASIHVSERFFAFESLAKSLCAVSCIQFLYKVIEPNSIIQHNEVLKTLKRLGPKGKSVSCKTCRFFDVCHPKQEFSLLSKAYICLIHLRMVKDYREECIFDGNIQAYFISDFFDLSQEILWLTEEFNEASTGTFLTRPLSFREETELLKAQVHAKRGLP